MTKIQPNDIFEKTSFLHGSNTVYIEQMYEKFRSNPKDVPNDWKEFFTNIKSKLENENLLRASWDRNSSQIKDEYLDIVKNNKTKPRIPFGSLIELGVIKPGTEIYDQKKKIYAKVMVDGSIKHKGNEGSIHKVAAQILGAESCNGWTYWHYEVGNSLKPIDDLRQSLKPGF